METMFIIELGNNKFYILNGLLSTNLLNISSTINNELEVIFDVRMRDIFDIQNNYFLEDQTIDHRRMKKILEWSINTYTELVRKEIRIVDRVIISWE